MYFFVAFLSLHCPRTKNTKKKKIQKTEKCNYAKIREVHACTLSWFGYGTVT